MSKTHKLIVVGGPSSIGKTHLFHLLDMARPGEFVHAKVLTTRPQRKHDSAMPVGRVFVDDKEYDARAANDEFFFEETFAGSRYGYPRESLHPTTQHIVVDVSPWLLHKLTSLPNAVFIGLSPSVTLKKQLQERMQQRGDTPEAIERRIPFIHRDIEFLEANKSFFDGRGRLFVIEDNDSLPNEVVPYILAEID